MKWFFKSSLIKPLEHAISLPYRSEKNKSFFSFFLSASVISDLGKVDGTSTQWMRCILLSCKSTILVKAPKSVLVHRMTHAIYVWRHSWAQTDSYIGVGIKWPHSIRTAHLISNISASGTWPRQIIQLWISYLCIYQLLGHLPKKTLPWMTFGDGFFFLSSNYSSGSVGLGSRRQRRRTAVRHHVAGAGRFAEIGAVVQGFNWNSIVQVYIKSWMNGWIRCNPLVHYFNELSGKKNFAWPI